MLARIPVRHIMCQVAIIPVTHQPAWVVLFADNLVSVGFPSPAEDDRGVKLDLNQLLLRTITIHLSSPYTMISLTPLRDDSMSKLVTVE